jgi:tripartite-type tricarboxylate transporter receptor subunit TctC
MGYPQFGPHANGNLIVAVVRFTKPFVATGGQTPSETFHPIDNIVFSPQSFIYNTQSYIRTAPDFPKYILAKGFVE